MTAYSYLGYKFQLLLSDLHQMWNPRELAKILLLRLGFFGLAGFLVVICSLDIWGDEIALANFDLKPLHHHLGFIRGDWLSLATRTTAFQTWWPGIALFLATLRAAEHEQKFINIKNLRNSWSQEARLVLWTPVSLAWADKSRKTPTWGTNIS